jgi:hypothetical protein
MASRLVERKALAVALKAVVKECQVSSEQLSEGSA